MTDPSEARQQAEKAVDWWFKQSWCSLCGSIDGCEHNRRRLAGLLAAEIQRAVDVQQAKYDELRIQFQAAQEKIDQLRDEKQRAVADVEEKYTRLFNDADYDADARVQRAVDEEREACAEIAEGFRMPDGKIPTDTGMIWRHSAAVSIAKAIRARQRAGGS